MLLGEPNLRHRHTKKKAPRRIRLAGGVESKHCKEIQETNGFLGARKERMRGEVGLHWKYLNSDRSRRRGLFPNIKAKCT